MLQSSHFVGLDNHHRFLQKDESQCRSDGRIPLAFQFLLCNTVRFHSDCGYTDTVPCGGTTGLCRGPETFSSCLLTSYFLHSYQRGGSPKLESQALSNLDHEPSNL